jgi:histidine triad (HIT) family protein
MSDEVSCPFCQIAAGRIPARKLFETERVVAFHDVNPQAPVHVLVIPRRHVATLNDLGSDDALLVGELFLAAQRVARELDIAARGYRTLINCNQEAGQSVYHVHLHVLGGRPMGWPPG